MIKTNENGQRLPHSPFRLQLCGGLAYTVGILIGKNLLRNYVAPVSFFLSVWRSAPVFSYLFVICKQCARCALWRTLDDSLLPNAD